ncbi:hypothetical protein HVPorG_01465 [Roseomonas mucosa]|uniref:hypothetical protein n=1 Tax=Roseomonas mucosa TaxID=207340 RepID=UPI0021FF0B2F|nr:hypothetical protein [Roseomonas mucosa]QDJ09243.1 hypothetical protein HVPorG_01465 [Roseomonas mucosa]
MVTWKNALATTAATLALGAVLSAAPVAAQTATSPSASGQPHMGGHGAMPQHHRMSRNRMQDQQSASADDSAADRLNAESLQRARGGQNSPSGMSDTTPTLNNMSGQDAQRGMNTGSQPMVPFR